VARFFRERSEELARARDEGGDATRIVALAKGAVEEACRVVHDLAVSTPERQGMGSTLTVLLGAGNKAVMAHVGDSRLYLARGGSAHMISADHTVAAELARQGVITADKVPSHAYAHVLSRAVGTHRAVQVDTLAVDVVPGDRFLLCSDGFSDYVPSDEWLAERLAAEDIDILPDELVKFADESGGKDNITVVVVAIEADAPEAERAIELATDVEVRLDAISSTFLFKDLTLAQLARVLDIAEVRSHGAGDTIVSEGDKLDQLFLVLDGHLGATPAGKVVATLSPGDHLGASTLLLPRPARATVRASEPSRTLSLAHERFHTLARARPWLGVDLLARLGRRACAGATDAV
jgi:serine/threonine protein phosphatase PrpC